MCGLCGAFGAADHWTDSPGDTARATPHAERIRRATAANRILGHYGLKLSQWGGRYTLTGRTGRSAVVDHFGMLWPEAERIAGRTCDPLDPKILDAIERQTPAA